MSPKMTYNLLFLGKGWSSMQTLFFFIEEMKKALSQRPKSEFKQILFTQPLKIGVIYHDQLAPACSLRSTSLCALRGAKPHTPIGRLLVNGYEEVKSFVEYYQPEGVEKISLTSITTNKGPWSQDVQRRFGEDLKRLDQHPIYHQSWSLDGWGVEEEAFMFHERLYEQWWKKTLLQNIETIKQSFGITILVDWLTEFISEPWSIQQDHFQVTTSTGHVFSSMVLVSALGAYEQLHFHHDLGQSISTGSYLHFSSLDWGEKSWAINIHQKHILVYRACSKELLLTLSSQKGAYLYPHAFDIVGAYAMAKQIVCPSLPSCYHWPDLCQGKILAGLRLKGKQRKPYWGRDSERGHYQIGATYKNGLSYSFLGGKELAAMIWKDHYLANSTLTEI
jgi:hypothetical protein